MSKLKKKSVTPYKFYTDKDLELDFQMGMEFSNDDAIAKVTLYRIDIKNTKTHNLYGETKAKNKQFLTPIELNVTINELEIEDNFKAKEGIKHQNIGKLTFGVYKNELENKKCDIKIGDFISYFDGEKDRNFEVTNVSNIASNNSILNYKPMYMNVTCVMVLSDVFKK